MGTMIQISKDNKAGKNCTGAREKGNFILQKNLQHRAKFILNTRFITHHMVFYSIFLTDFAISICLIAVTKAIMTLLVCYNHQYMIYSS